MFSLRSYRSLREEEDNPYGKTLLYNCCDADVAVARAAVVTCPSTPSPTSPVSDSRSSVASTSSSPSALATSSTIAPPTSSHLSFILTTTTTTTTTSSSSKSNASSSSSSPASITLHSIKAAWKSLSSLSFSSARLPHLERAESSPDPPHSHDYRYTQFPTATTATTTTSSSKRPHHKESPFHHTHLHISPSSRLYGFPHHRSSTGTASTSASANSSTSSLTLAHCLRRRKTKSKSDNALQKIGVGLKSHSDQNLHRVCLIGGTSSISPSSNAIFSNVHLSGGSGDSCGSVGSGTGTNRYRGFPQRSRSLERNHHTRVQSHNHTRSLERNHKFHVNLRSSFPSPSTRDFPPDHPAPPPPTGAFVRREGHLWTRATASAQTGSGPDGVDGSGGSISICSNSSSSSSSSGGSAMEGGQGGGAFINKPPRGWLHPDQQLAEEGICYGVRYIGALEVNTSMKSLNFDTRSLIAKECISKVCEAAGLKTADRKRKVVKSIGRIVGERPLMDHAGSNVTLTITSAALTLTTLESGSVVASHDMPNISFASGGDPDTLDFIAYVAKDNRYGRACFVLECGGGLAQDVITTIGQAFELRFKEYLKKTPSTVQYSHVKSESAGSVANGDPSHPWNSKDYREYYNDLPGKMPPDLVPPPVPPLPQYSGSKTGATTTHPSTTSPLSPTSSSTSVHSTTAEKTHTTSAVLQSATSAACNTNNLSSLHRANDNLIDLSSDVVNLLPPSAAPKAEPEYVNDSVIKQRQMTKDPFDMQPFSMQLTQLGRESHTMTSTNILGGTITGGTIGTVSQNKPLPLNQRLKLQKEMWFHGPISRREAEALLKQDGDFLVRESQGNAGQYVLTGIQNNIKKHLLLVDPEGVVRTKSRTFDSVSHLINYHRDNELPIVSAESALVLRNPVPRSH